MNWTTVRRKNTSRFSDRSFRGRRVCDDCATIGCWCRRTVMIWYPAAAVAVYRKSHGTWKRHSKAQRTARTFGRTLAVNKFRQKCARSEVKVRNRRRRIECWTQACLMHAPKTPICNLSMMYNRLSSLQKSAKTDATLARQIKRPEISVRRNQCPRYWFGWPLLVLRWTRATAQR